MAECLVVHDHSEPEGNPAAEQHRDPGELLRRGDDGSWSAGASMIEDGELTLDSIWFTVPLAAIYRTTRLTRG
jgi:hypothetical protein